MQSKAKANQKYTLWQDGEQAQEGLLHWRSQDLKLLLGLQRWEWSVLENWVMCH
jgi:hypothetical protein